ncbi:MAG: hypothetical protein NT076_02660 [Candidatus Pacearchaeota archaeon]|nr:hypothetical protein [Candidatus Pacearchaeota archaeon]
MSYKVRVEVGKGKNKSVTESIPLPSKKRVCGYIKKNPLVKSNTNVRVTNLSNGKVTTGKQSKFCSKIRKVDF